MAIGDPKGIEIWDFKNNQSLGRFSGNYINGMEYSDDGNLLVTTDGDNGLVVWNMDPFFLD